MARALNALVVATSVVMLSAGATSACPKPEKAIGLARVVEIDTTAGPLFGSISKEDKEEGFLEPGEVVLTFDDGPSPWVTTPILETLDRHCTKATFFAVGKMAVAYPAVVRDVADRGHTLGGHTWSHPRNMPGLKPARAQDEIERGFAAIAAASDGEVAPFFRFTGLRDSGPLLGYLQTRGIGAFTVDVVSDDSFIDSVDELVRVTIARTVEKKGGILLFHDIKPATAKALPRILDELKARGFRVVHLRASAPLAVRPELVDGFRAEVAARLAEEGEPSRPQLMPFYGAVAALREGPKETKPESLPVTRLAPSPRVRPTTTRPGRPTTTGTLPEIADPGDNPGANPLGPPPAVPQRQPPGRPAPAAAPPAEPVEELPWKKNGWQSRTLEERTAARVAAPAP
ncbi:MAG: polysaccharide deacetylase family protein [Hyphomicrobiaceae bacterium]|nr:polysaccharide deacetylase family protein [Hyphomicrobiaceae bacterium]